MCSRGTTSSWPELSSDELLRGKGVSLLWRVRLRPDPEYDCPRRLGFIDLDGAEWERSQVVEEVEADMS